MKIRDRYRSGSNNPANLNKNICLLRIAEGFGVADQVRYLHTIDDLVRALRAQKNLFGRARYLVRSRKSRLAKGSTVGRARTKCQDIGAAFYVVRVDGHALLLGCDGRTLVDTDPRKRDRRKITHFYGVYWQ